MGASMLPDREGPDEGGSMHGRPRNRGECAC